MTLCISAMLQRDPGYEFSLVLRPGSLWILLSWPSGASHLRNYFFNCNRGVILSQAYGSSVYRGNPHMDAQS
jgi:hypothetical protein